MVVLGVADFIAMAYDLSPVSVMRGLSGPSSLCRR